MLKKFFLCVILLITTYFTSKSQIVQTPTLKQVMLNQLKSTHNKEEWFVPLNIAIEGLSPEQANWKEKGGDHSIAELTNHLIFWNQDQLSKFLNEPQPKFSGDNKQTFSPAEKESWPATVKKADSLMVSWEKAIEAADEKKLAAWYEIIGHISTHNAYHTGQIVYIRKVQGSWNPDRGVKQ